ncbi:MAG: hypothetical protein ACK4RS_03695, partial [Thiothrix sp.]
MISTQQLAFLHRLARLLAVSVSAIGGIVLFGWWNNIDQLYQVAKNLPSMLPNEALSFMLLGMTLLLLQPAQLPHWRRMAGLLLATGGFCVSIVMLLKLLGLVPTHVGNDWLWIALLLADASPQAILAFLLTSIGLFFLGLERLHLINIAQWAALFSVMALVVIFLGFAHEEDVFYLLSGYHGMSLPSASAFALLGWGIILAKVEHGFLRIMAHNSAGGEVARRVIFLMAIFPAMLGWLPLLLDSERLTHTQIESLLAAVMILFIIVMII